MLGIVVGQRFSEFSMIYLLELAGSPKRKSTFN
jgi:hypothetical protein